MKVYITKYALTKKGIIEAEATDFSRYGEIWRAKAGEDEYSYLCADEYSSSRDEAVIRANEMRQKKIASLKKQIARLESLKFE